VGCLRSSTVTTPIMASRGTFGGYRNIATKSRGSGTSGWNVEREGSCSHGHASTRSAPAIHCQRPGSSTAIPDRTNLSREEPNASIAHVRVCGGRGWKHPRLPGSGGKDKLGSISKQGDRYLRSLFTAGALAVIRYAKLHGTKHRPWLTALLARRPTKVAAIALANKIARMAWAMMTR